MLRLRLKKVHLRNFRIHDDYTFEPMIDGVTAIVGRNGHGKSTIIDGIAWALYGTKPNSGIKNSAWRRIGAPEDEPSFVDAVFEYGDSELRVKRSIVNAKNGGAQCECWLDGVLEAGPAVSHATSWITKTLGMDEDGFLSTILVQQKHVGQLVSASRAERRRTLERLTGITAVTNALDQAKTEERSYSKAVEAYGVDEERLPKLRDEADKNIKKRDEALARVDKMKTQLSKLDKEGRALKKRVDAMDSVLAKSRDLIASKTSAENESEYLEERISSLSELKGKLSAGLPARKLDVDEMNKIQADLDEAEDALSKAEADVESHRRIVDSRPTDEDMAKADSEIADAMKTLESIDGDTASKTIESERENAAMAKANGMQARKSLEELKGHNQCPTCLQDIEDPSSLMSHFEEIISDAHAQVDESKKKMETARETLEKLDAAKADLEDRRQSKADLEELRTKADDAEASIAVLMAEVETRRATVKSLRKTVSRFNEYKAKYAEYDRALNDLKDAITRKENADKTIRVIAKQLDELGSVDDVKLAKMRADLDDKRSKRADLNASMIEKKGVADVADANAIAASREADELEEQINNRKALLSKLEVAAGSVSVLGKFREHMILSAIPQVTDYASDLISKISDGRFVTITIDQKFDINVETGDGVIESVSQLSGGEEDLVAICLRLAISVMLSNGAPTMLILDEVLTAMDSDRATAILEAMQGMSDGQIIIVAHNEIVKSIADKVVEL